MSIGRMKWKKTKLGHAAMRSESGSSVLRVAERGPVTACQVTRAVACRTRSVVGRSLLTGSTNYLTLSSMKYSRRLPSARISLSGIETAQQRRGAGRVADTSIQSLMASDPLHLYCARGTLRGSERLIQATECHSSTASPSGWHIDTQVQCVCFACKSV